MKTRKLTDNNTGPNYGAVPSVDSSGQIIIEDVDEDFPKPVEFEERGSNWIAYVHIVCVVAGSGTLGIPYAVKEGGWASLVILILSAVMAYYSNNKLIQCLYYDGRTRKESLPKVAYDAFGSLGLIVVGFFYNAIAVGCPILYLILSGVNFDNIFSDLGINWGVETWVYISALISGVPFIFIKTMKDGAWLSVFGVLTVVFVVIVVFFVSIVEYPKNPDRGHDIINLRNIPLAMGTFSFSYGGNIIFPHVEASMRNPSAWPRANALALTTLAMMYLIISVPAYLTYGRDTISPIYLNLPHGSAVTLSIVMITAHVLFATPIYLTAFSLELESYLGISVENIGKYRDHLWRTVLRALLVLLVARVAVNAPYFDKVMSLLGAMGNGLLIVVVPMVIWIKLIGFNRLNGIREKTWVVFIMTFASIAAVIGTWDASVALWNAINGVEGTELLSDSP